MEVDRWDKRIIALLLLLSFCAACGSTAVPPLRALVIGKTYTYQSVDFTVKDFTAGLTGADPQVQRTTTLPPWEHGLFRLVVTITNHQAVSRTIAPYFTNATTEASLNFPPQYVDATDCSLNCDAAETLSANATKTLTFLCQWLPDVPAQISMHLYVAAPDSNGNGPLPPALFLLTVPASGSTNS